MKNKLKFKKKDIEEIPINNQIISELKTSYTFNFIIISICLILKIEAKILLNSDSEISITINGTGNQPILFNLPIKDRFGIYRLFTTIPSQIYVNEVLQNYTGKMVTNLENEINNVTMIFNTSIIDASAMFKNLKNIIKVDLSKMNASSITNMGHMFERCTSLISVNLDNQDFSSVTDMNNMFFECFSLKSLSLSNVKTSSIKYMISMFFNCISLKSLDLSHLNTSSLIDMSNMFTNCYSLEFLNINFDTSLVTRMTQVFYNCFSLEKLYISKINTSLVNDINSMFYNCNSLKFLNISNFDTSSVTSMECLFFNCSSLTSLSLENFDTSLVQTMREMFFNCSSLKYLNISNFNTSLVTDISNMFNNCISLISLNLSSFNTLSVTDMNGMFWSCNSLKSLDLSNFNTSSVIDMYGMFVDCYSLTSLDLSNFNTSSLIDIRYMFYDCSSLISLNLNSFNTSLITEMDGIFDGCSSLLSLKIDTFNTSLVINMPELFSRCSSLISLNLYNFNTSMVKNMIGIFNNCTNLTICINEEAGYQLKLYFQDNFKFDCNNTCFINSNHKLLKEKSICLNDCKDDKKYRYEYNNRCYEYCPEGTLNSIGDNYICQKIFSDNNNKDKIDGNINNYLENIFSLYNNNSDISNIDKIIINIKKEIINSISNISKSTTINKNNIKEFIIQKGNLIFQFSSFYNKKYKAYNNISFIDFRECENILRDFYNKENNSLLLFKADYFIQGFFIPLIEYEVYDLNENKIIDLNICKNMKVDFYIPVKIDEENLYKYNSSNEFYNDICYTFTTKYKTDIILKDRRNEFIYNNMSLCEKNCEYKGYDIITKKVKCECYIKIKFLLFSEIEINKDLLLNNFKDLNNIMNLNCMKCYKITLCTKGLKYNIGSYIILSIIFLEII